MEKEYKKLEDQFNNYYDIELYPDFKSEEAEEKIRKVKEKAEKYKSQRNIEAYKVGYEYLMLKYGSNPIVDCGKSIFDFEDFIVEHHLYDFYIDLGLYYFYEHDLVRAYAYAIECEKYMRNKLKNRTEESFFKYHSSLCLLASIANAKDDLRKMKKYCLDAIKLCNEYKEVYFIYLLLANTYAKLGEYNSAFMTLKNPKCGFFGLEELICAYTTGYLGMDELVLIYSPGYKNGAFYEIGEAYRHLKELLEYNDLHNTDYVTTLDDALIAYIMYANGKYEDTFNYIQKHASYDFIYEDHLKKYKEYKGDNILYDTKFLESTNIKCYYFVIGLMLYEGKVCKQDIKQGISYIEKAYQILKEYKNWNKEDIFFIREAQRILYEYTDDLYYLQQVV